jgi:hypothetical protein
MESPHKFPGSSALCHALDGGASFEHALLFATITQVSVFGRRRFAEHTRQLARVAREQELAEFQSQFEASL